MTDDRQPARFLPALQYSTLLLRIWIDASAFEATIDTSEYPSVPARRSRSRPLSARHTTVVGSIPASPVVIAIGYSSTKHLGNRTATAGSTCCSSASMPSSAAACALVATNARAVDGSTLVGSLCVCGHGLKHASCATRLVQTVARPLPENRTLYTSGPQPPRLADRSRCSHGPNVPGYVRRRQTHAHWRQVAAQSLGCCSSRRAYARICSCSALPGSTFAHTSSGSSCIESTADTSVGRPALSKRSRLADVSPAVG